MKKEKIDEQIKEYIRRASDISEKFGFRGGDRVLEIAKMIQKEELDYVKEEKH